MSQPITKVHSLHTMPRKQCDTHGLQPCYTICACVAKFSKPTAIVVRPSRSPSGIGQILCGRVDHEVHEITVVCIHCAVEKGWHVVKEPVS